MSLFKQVHESKQLRGRNNEAVATSCLFMACRKLKVPRTFKGKYYQFVAMLDDWLCRNLRRVECLEERYRKDIQKDRTYSVHQCRQRYWGRFYGSFLLSARRSEAGEDR